jgi:hypothetical protein
MHLCVVVRNTKIRIANKRAQSGDRKDAPRRTAAEVTSNSAVPPEFQLRPSKNRFLAPEKLKLSLISFTNPRASHAGNRGSKPLRGTNEINSLELSPLTSCNFSGEKLQLFLTIRSL